MSYLVLARKWRPQTFADLVGQGHVSRTLANAIAQNRVAHAFLFTGVRGVGKTTSARILAKALNCERGPTAEPCLACPACMDIAAGTDLDVQELDGATNNGVDEVRRLQDGLAYRPQRDRFKIFIVDEVHMLSQNAWNAFLKTLEEPPPHVKFIFATTEVHKVPVTVLSRCQRYDFKMIAAKTIGERLRYVLSEEKIEADEAAISLLAREAAGSMRDGMSLLDQAIAWNPERLVGEEVAQVLGVASRRTIHALAAALLEGKADVALRLVGGLVEGGQDLTNLAKNLLLHLRDLVVAKICANDAHALLDLTEDERRELGELAERAETDDLVRLHQGFSKAFDDTVRSVHPRAALEMTLVRLARRPPLLPLDELLARLGDLDKRLSGGGPGGPGGTGARSAPTPLRSAATFPTGGSSRGSAAEALGAVAFVAPAFATPAFATPAFATPGFAISASTTPASAARAPARPAPPSAPPPSTPPPSAPPPSAPPPSASRPVLARAQNVVSLVAAEPGLETVPARAILRAALPVALAPLPDPTPGVDMAAWRTVVAEIERTELALAAKLKLAVPLETSAARLAIGFPPDSIHREAVSDPRYVETMARAVRGVLGEACALVVELTSAATRGLTLAHLEAAERVKREADERAEITSHPLVQAALAALGAEVRDVKILRRD